MPMKATRMKGKAHLKVTAELESDQDSCPNY